MGELFQAKVRKIGSSAGILIPQEHMEMTGTEIGDTVDVALLVHRDFDLLDQAFGIAKGAKPFKRDKKTRGF